MIVIAVIGVLAAVAIPNFISYRKRAYNNSAHADAKNGWAAAQAYFCDYPEAALSSLVPLTAYGFRQTSAVTVTVGGSQSSLIMSAFHGSGDRTYTVYSEGTMSW